MIRSIDDDARDLDERTDLKDDKAGGRNGPLPDDRVHLRHLIEAAAKDRPRLSQLLGRLEQVGVRAVPSLQKSGHLNGMSYEFNGVRYKGSDLGRKYTASGLEKQGVQYDRGKDETSLQDAEARAREHPARSFKLHPDLRERSTLIREYDALDHTERAALREIGTFRTILVEDFVAIHYGGKTELWQDHLKQLSALRLLETRSMVVKTHDRNHNADTRVVDVVVLTRNGRNLLKRFDRENRKAGQAIYAGFVKPREIAHDAAIYRMYQKEAAHIQQQGGRIKRLVLDFELKKRAYVPLAKARAVSIAEYQRRQAEVARDMGLKIVDGKMRLPDLRIEYETETGEITHVDLELATEHYRGDHMSAKERAGFKIYADSRSFPPSSSSGRSSVLDDHGIEIFSF